MSCVVRRCRNSSHVTNKKEGITFHRFSKDNEAWRNDWIQIIRKCNGDNNWIPKKRSVICSLHFEAQDLYTTKRGLRRVVAYAVPKKFLFKPAQMTEEHPAAVTYISSVSQESTSFTVPSLDHPGSSTMILQREYLPDGPNISNALLEPNSDPISQSVVSLEQPNMSNLLLSIKTEDYGLYEDITETAPVPTLFCMCCLRREVPFVKFLTCSHADFLNSMMIPEIKLQNQVICYECHEKLKKIKLFKLQVEESFKLLSDISTENTPKYSNQKHNLKIHQAFQIDIPQKQFNNTENPETILEDVNINLNDIIKVEDEIFDNTEKSPPPESSQNKNMKNIEEAMRIINNNQNSDCINFLANSLQSISHSLLSDVFNNFELGGQNDTYPTEIITNINTESTTTVNPIENLTNDVLNENLTTEKNENLTIEKNENLTIEKNENLTTEKNENLTIEKNENLTIENNENLTIEKNENLTIVNNENIDKEEIDRIVSENLDTVANVANEGLNRAVTEKESIDEYDMQTDETVVPYDRRPSLGSSIKQLTLTREQLMQERTQIATSQSYLRALHHCESCLIGFQFQENLEDHVKRKHTPGFQTRNTIECDVCLQHVSKSARNMHMFWHYTRYECVACAEKFASYDKAALHYKRKHGRSNASFKCPHCPYKTCRMSWFAEHLKAYTECKSCGVMFGCATGMKLQVHKRYCVGGKLKTGSKSKKPKVTSATGSILKTLLKKECVSDSSEENDID